MSTNLTPQEYLNLQSEIDKIQKEKSTLEGQLVIYKLKYAECSSSLMDSDDQRTLLKKKNEDLIEKIKVKDEIIKNLVSERDEIRTAYYNCSLTNRSETIQNFQSSYLNTNNASMTQRNLNTNEYSFKNSDINNNPNLNSLTSHKEPSLISLAQIQNKDKQLRRMTTTSVLETKNNKSILSRNIDHFENKNLFDVEKSYANIDNNNNNNSKKNNNKLEDHITSLNPCVNNTKDNKKSKGLIGSIKNLFNNDKSKKNLHY